MKEAKIEMEKEVFKVVFKRGIDLVSALEIRYQVTYKPNEWSKTQIGKLFAFETLDHARDFKKDWEDYGCYEVWKGIGKNVAKIKWVCPHNNHKEIEDFWNGKNPPNLDIAPLGTVVVTEFKPLEKVT